MIVMLPPAKPSAPTHPISDLSLTLVQLLELMFLKPNKDKDLTTPNQYATKLFSTTKELIIAPHPTSYIISTEHAIGVTDKALALKGLFRK